MEKKQILAIFKKYIYQDGDILVMYSKRIPGKIADEILKLLPIEQEPPKEVKSAEDELKSIFADLWINAYDAEYHHYEYKPANQIIRKHFEEYASQFQTEQRQVTDLDIITEKANWIRQESARGYCGYAFECGAKWMRKAMRDNKIGK